MTDAPPVRGPDTPVSPPEEPSPTGEGAPTRRRPLIAWYWWLPGLALAGFVLSLAFPNEVLPGTWRDHPSSLLAYFALAPFLYVLLAWKPGPARWATLIYGLTFYGGTVMWARLFGQGVLAIVPPLGLALFLTLSLLIAVCLFQAMRLPRAWQPLGLATAWVGMEWLRGQGPFGFAWAEIGQSQVDNPLSALARLGGVPLITFLMIWVVGEAMLLLITWCEGKRDWHLFIMFHGKHGVDDRTTNLRWSVKRCLSLLCLLRGLGLSIGVSVLLWLFGATGIHDDLQYHSHPLTRISVVQPNTLFGLTAEDLERDISSTELDRRLTVNLNLSAVANAALPARPPIRERVRDYGPLIIWPESSIPYDPANEPRITEFVQRTGVPMLIGAPVEDPQTMKVYNMATLLAPLPWPELRTYGDWPNGEVAARYRKVHLVPFGEYVPWRAFVEKHFYVRQTDISPGEGHPIMTHEGIAPADNLPRCGIMICFESTFSDIAREYAARGAQLLVVMTNDAWFHDATHITGAVQMHVNHARFRAIETGLPVARAATTGISCFIEPDGSVHDAIPLGVAGQRTTWVQVGEPGLLLPGTFHTAVGWLFAPACLLAALLLAVLGLWRGYGDGLKRFLHIP